MQQHQLYLKMYLQPQLEQLKFRRSVLLGLLENNGWNWGVIYKSKGYIRNMILNIRSEYSSAIMPPKEIYLVFKKIDDT